MYTHKDIDIYTHIYKYTSSYIYILTQEDKGAGGKREPSPTAWRVHGDRRYPVYPGGLWC